MNNINSIMPNNSTADLEDAKRTIDALFELSKILRCDVDKNTLSQLVSLTESKINPLHLATFVN